MWKDLADSMNNVLLRYEKYYDPEIARTWVELADQKPPETIATRKGLSLIVHRIPGRNRVDYEGYVAGHSAPVASIRCLGPRAGRVQISNAQVFEVGGVDYRRKGIGTAIYDLIEGDVVAAGGQCIEPHWGPP